jgi:hypothetical protein
MCKDDFAACICDGPVRQHVVAENKHGIGKGVAFWP